MKGIPTPDGSSVDSATALANDLLRGAAAIAEYIGETERRVYYLAEKRLIPIGKEGLALVASKTVLKAHYARLTGAAE